MKPSGDQRSLPFLAARPGTLADVTVSKRHAAGYPSTSAARSRTGGPLRWNNVCIEAMGYVLPEQVVTSDELDEAIRPLLKRIGLPPGQVEKLSGVRERRYWDPGMLPSVAAAQAGQVTLQNAGVAPKDVDVLINTSVSRDYLEPATAALIAGHLGLPHSCGFFDVTNACVGFLNGLILAANMIELGQANIILVVDAECVRDGVLATIARMNAEGANADTFRSNFATLTLGCGAVGCVVMRKDWSNNKHELQGAVARSAPEHNRLCLASPDEMWSDPGGLLTHGVGLAVETWPHAAAALGWRSQADIDVFICHQVSVSHFSHSFAALEFDLAKAPLTLPYIGNCGPASTPLTLALSEAQGRVIPGQQLCLYGVGSGLSCVIMGVRW
jgi:3-oxoacyl-[acyl-carrier-protein] synthase III